MIEKNHTAQDIRQPKDTENSTDLGDLGGVLIAGAWAFVITLLAAAFWPNMTERLKFFIATLWVLVTAFAVIAQVIINRRQWQVMQDGLDRTDRVIQKMQDSIDASDRALRASQRAYVGLQKEPQLSLHLGQNPEIEVHFINTGRTPAHVVEFRYKFSSQNDDYYTFKEYKGVKYDFFIFAGTPKRVHCVWNYQYMDAEWLKRIEDKASNIFFVGRLVYQDVWGDSKNFDGDVIRFQYFSFGTHELREAFIGDKDYEQADFVVELDGTEEEIISDEPPWEPEEPPDYVPYNPFDV